MDDPGHPRVGGEHLTKVKEQEEGQSGPSYRVTCNCGKRWETPIYKRRGLQRKIDRGGFFEA